MDRLQKGYVAVYTGDGKGKTTAAVGQAVRSAGNGLKVYMVQFLKTDNTGELETAKIIGENFKIFRFQKQEGFFWTLNEEEKEKVRKEVNKALEFVKDVIDNNRCDVLILDEIMGVIKNNLIKPDIVIELINKKPETMELILTGRDAPESIIDKADLVTEMRNIKHYIEKGVYAREGIEY